jgi:lipopolysaccharide export system protein LptA
MKHPGLILLCCFVLFTLAQDASSSETVSTQEKTNAEDVTPQEPATSEETTNPSSTPDATEETSGEASNKDLPTAKRSMKISRKDREIKVTNNAPDEQGGQFRLNVPDCEKDLRLSTIYAPEEYIIETLVNEATILSQIAISRRPPNKEDENGEIIERGADKEKLELFNGSLKVPDPDLPCPKEIKSDDTNITLKEGRTTVQGLNFLYSNATGIGNMKGPITLDRVAEGDSPALNATSDTMEVNVDDDKTFLEGNVKVTSEDRVSEATTLEYNEEQGIAILRGDKRKGIPAKSTKGSDVLQGDTIIYYLDTNDVKILGGLQGEIEVDLGDGSSGNTGDGSNTETPADGANQDTTNNDGTTSP